MTDVLQVPRQSNESIIKCFRLIDEVVGGNGVLHFHLIGVPNQKHAFESEEIKSIESSSLEIIEIASVTKDGFSVAYHRGGQGQAKSPFYDEVHFNYHKSHLDNSVKIQVVALVAEELRAFSPDRGIGLTEAQTQLEAMHAATLERLESLNEDLLRSTHEYRRKVDDEGAEKEKRLDAEYQSRVDAIEEEKKALEKLRDELDDRSNTHARRDLRKDIIREIKARQTEFTLTEGTINLRKPVSVAMFFLISFFVLGVLFYGYEFYSVFGGDNLQKIVAAGVKQGFFSIGAVTSLVFYIKWSNRWAQQHSEAEFHLKQLELDMERASWLVETALEWKDAKGTEIPKELLRSLSANLFSNNAPKDDGLVHPADQLASALLGSSSAVKLKAGDSEIVIDPKKLAKAKQKPAAEVAPEA